MEKSRLSAYLKLIKKLLTCPQGEEWIYLKRYEDLVDAEFVQFMEQVAIQVDQEGDYTTATFLHSWAAQLHHIMLKEIKPSMSDEDRAGDYFSLIKQLLTCPKEMEEQLLISHETLLGPGLVHSMYQVAKQLRRQGESEPAEYLESIASTLSQEWLNGHDFSPSLQKASASRASASRSPAPYAKSYATVASKTFPEPASLTSFEDFNMSKQSTKSLAEEMDDLWDAPWEEPSEESSKAELIMQSNGHLPEPERSDLKETKAAPVTTVFPSIEQNLSATGEPREQAVEQALDRPVEQPITEGSGQQAIADGLNAIAQALQQLNHTLSHQSAAAPNHPLQHLESLEQACQAHWQLTTEEIEHLLGVKPKCHSHETTYRRGEWCFTKAGKLGSQTAWHVTKENT